MLPQLKVLDIWYVAMYIKRRQSLFKSYSWGQIPPPGSHVLHKSYVCSNRVLENSASLSGPLVPLVLYKY